MAEIPGAEYVLHETAAEVYGEEADEEEYEEDDGEDDDDGGISVGRR